jgi:hypothetical protein
MSYCEITFAGPEYTGFEEGLGGLRDKLLDAANNEALDKQDYEKCKNPTDIKILPVKTLDEMRFMVSAYHTTASTSGEAAIFRNYDFSFTYSVEGEDAYLRTDTERAYPLTARELVLLMSLGNIATAKSLDAQL